MKSLAAERDMRKMMEWKLSKYIIYMKETFKE